MTIIEPLNYQRTRTDAFGFPRLLCGRTKRVRGFQTGDMVRATVPKGKNAGVHVGRVAVRSKGYFAVHTSTGKIDGISYRHCAVLARACGYFFSIQPGAALSSPSTNAGVASAGTA